MGGYPGEFFAEFEDPFRLVTGSHVFSVPDENFGEIFDFSEVASDLGGFSLLGTGPVQIFYVLPDARVIAGNVKVAGVNEDWIVIEKENDQVPVGLDHVFLEIRLDQV